jgi:alanine racemase
MMHIYVNELINKGVHNFVVQYIPDGWWSVLILVVEDTLVALQQFASYYRSFFDFPVIGLTGSNGKRLLRNGLIFF